MSETKLTTSQKNELRAATLKTIAETFELAGDMTVEVANTAFAVPAVVDGIETWVEVSVKVPSGPKDGTGYDPFALRTSLLNERAIQAQKAADALAKKVKAQEEREAKALAKETAKAQKEADEEEMAEGEDEDFNDFSAEVEGDEEEESEA